MGGLFVFWGIDICPMLWYCNNVIRQRMWIETFDFRFSDREKMRYCASFFFPPVISPNPKDLSSFWDKISGTYRAGLSS